MKTLKLEGQSPPREASSSLELTTDRTGRECRRFASDEADRKSSFDISSLTHNSHWPSAILFQRTLSYFILVVVRSLTSESSAELSAVTAIVSRAFAGTNGAYRSCLTRPPVYMSRRRPAGRLLNDVRADGGSAPATCEVRRAGISTAAAVHRIRAATRNLPPAATQEMCTSGPPSQPRCWH